MTDDAGPEVAEPHVTRLCVEAQECMVMGRWLDLASLMLTSADLVFSKVFEKDLECIFGHLQSCYKDCKSRGSSGDGKTYIWENHSATKLQASIAPEDIVQSLQSA